MLHQTAKIIREDITSPIAQEEYGKFDVGVAQKNFWYYRIVMNPRLRLKGMWFPRSLAIRLKEFYVDFKAGKKPVMLLCTPPQHGKSLSVIDFISWAVGHDPELRVIYSSFSDRLGIRANLRLQRALDSKKYRLIFPQTRLNDKHIVTIAERALRNHDVLEFVGHEGYFRNTTVLGSITGEALDLSVIDDPIKGRAEAQSELQREKTWNWMTDDVLSRFSETAGLIMIMTRWHVDDPAGRMIAHFGKRVQVVRYPAIGEQDDYLDGKVQRGPGEPLFPELKSLEFLLERRKLYTQASWEALYQQNPFIVGGGIFPIEKLVPLSILDRTKILKSVRYWDKAGTESEDAAFTAGALLHMLKDNRFVIEHVVRGQWGALDREEKIKYWAERDRAQLRPGAYEVGVEQEPGSGGKESAESTIRNLRGFKVYADKVTGAKEVRAEPFAAQVQGGNVYIVAGIWQNDLLDEMVSFPNGKFKDQVDACSGAFNRLISGPVYNLWGGALD
jgi:predicted phage terminase large subunit-like protein